MLDRAPGGVDEAGLLVAVQRRIDHPTVVRAARAMSLFGEHAAGWLALGAAGAALDPARRRTWATAAVGVAGAHGASIAVDGTCLTIVGWSGSDGEFTVDFDVMGETLKRTSLGARQVGERVNLERAARVAERREPLAEPRHEPVEDGPALEREPVGERARHGAGRAPLPGRLVQHERDPRAVAARARKARVRPDGVG